MQGSEEDEGQLNLFGSCTIADRIPSVRSFGRSGDGGYACRRLLDAISIGWRPRDINTTSSCTVADAAKPRGHSGLHLFVYHFSPELTSTIQQHRNKPKEPPKKPEHAPFFLPTLPGVEHRFAIEEKKQGKQDKETRRLDRHATKSQSILQRLLTELERNGGCMFLPRSRLLCV